MPNILISAKFWETIGKFYKLVKQHVIVKLHIKFETAVLSNAKMKKGIFYSPLISQKYG